MIKDLSFQHVDIIEFQVSQNEDKVQWAPRGMIFVALRPVLTKRVEAWPVWRKRVKADEG